MDTQRKLKRIQLVTALDVLHPETDRILGVVLNLHTEGIAIRARQPFTLGSQYLLKVRLPVELMPVDVIEILGRCVWCRPSDNPDLTDAGFVLTDVTPDVQEVIEDVIRRYRR